MTAERGAPMFLRFDGPEFVATDLLVTVGLIVLATGRAAAKDKSCPDRLRE
jgi:hypothetical protein